MNELKIKNIKDQVMVITGASSGIGLATAKLAASKGARVVLSSRNKPDLKRAVDEIKRAGGRAIYVTADVSDINAVRGIRAEALSAFGRIDTWVNNAGVGLFGNVIDTPIEEARALFDSNFWGIHNGCMVAIEAMRDTGGVIINLGSEVSERAIQLQTFYSASKAAIKGYTEGLRVECAEDKLPIKFTLIRPAAINTPFSEHAPNHLRQGEPSLPFPVYAPEVVASAIVEASQTGKRDVYVGGASKVISVLEHIAPALLDFAVQMQTKDLMNGETKPHLEKNTGLMHRPAQEGSIHGGHKGHVSKSSVWTSASLHPMAAVFAVAGFGAAAFASYKFFGAGQKLSVLPTGANPVAARASAAPEHA